MKDKTQANSFDKIFKENMEVALPGVIAHVLQLDIIASEELPDDLQHTKERKPDVLKKVTDRQQQTYILHIEWQLKNERDMIFRMAEYFVMLRRKYQLPVKQYVLFLGNGKPSMIYQIEEPDFVFRYRLISFSQIHYQLFLESAQPEEKVLAMLANFGTEEPAIALRRIAKSVHTISSGMLNNDRYFNQLRVLAQLRNLQPLLNEIMESITEFFKIEKDPFYIRGEEKKSREVVINLIAKMGLNDEQVAEIAAVSIEFVQSIRKTLDNK